MARIRSIKPEFFTSLDVARLPMRARLTWIGLWTMLDDEGRGDDDARLVRAAVWPLDDDITTADVEADLAALAEAGHLVRYSVDGRRFLAVPTFTDHQHPNRPKPSKYPAPPVSDGAVTMHAPGTDDTRQEGRGEERRGGVHRTPSDAARPSPFCPKHPRGTDAPCRACGDARKLSEAWKPALARAPGVHSQPDCPKHPHYPHPDSPSGCPRCQEEAAA